MKFLCAAIGAALFASVAVAAELKEGADWRNCSDDKQCVMIDGVCGKTAVNRLVKKQAEMFYREKAREASCVSRFWEPAEQTPRCRLGGCETIPKQAQ